MRSPKFPFSSAVPKASTCIRSNLLTNITDWSFSIIQTDVKYWGFIICFALIARCARRPITSSNLLKYCPLFWLDPIFNSISLSRITVPFGNDVFAITTPVLVLSVLLFFNNLRVLMLISHSAPKSSHEILSVL